jgi:hypothetical protein
MCEPVCISDLASKLPFSIAAIADPDSAREGSFQRDLARRAVRDVQRDIRLIQAFIAARDDMTVAAAEALLK